ncbi:MAG: hypothetical protein V4714_05985 [Bacteroidota bacterium]
MPLSSVLAWVDSQQRYYWVKATRALMGETYDKAIIEGDAYAFVCKKIFLTEQDLTIVGVGSALFSGLLTASSILNKNLMEEALRYKAK